MFNYLNGTVAELLPNQAVIDCGGLGFQVNISTYSAGRLKTGEKAKVLTYVYIREDIFEIYGFTAPAEKRCFELLIGVSGVGPKAALAILSTAPPENLMMSILSGDEKAIMAAQGVGKKIAQRVILELKDKLARETKEISFPGAAAYAPAPAGGGARSDAAAALAVLGYSAPEINAALRKIEDQGQTTDELVKAALRLMMQ